MAWPSKWSRSIAVLKEIMKGADKPWPALYYALGALCFFLTISTKKWEVERKAILNKIFFLWRISKLPLWNPSLFKALSSMHRHMTRQVPYALLLAYRKSHYVCNDWCVLDTNVHTNLLVWNVWWTFLLLVQPVLHQTSRGGISPFSSFCVERCLR